MLQDKKPSQPTISRYLSCTNTSNKVRAWATCSAAVLDVRVFMQFLVTSNVPHLTNSSIGITRAASQHHRRHQATNATECSVGKKRLLVFFVGFWTR